MKTIDIVREPDREIRRTVVIPAKIDEDGNVIRREISRERVVKRHVCRAVERDMTTEEEKSYTPAPPLPSPTYDYGQRIGSVEDRVNAIETTTDDMILLMADLIGGA